MEHPVVLEPSINVLESKCDSVYMQDVMPTIFTIYVVFAAEKLNNHPLTKSPLASIDGDNLYKCVTFEQKKQHTTTKS